MENKKVILAFSGGLDTTFCVVYLKEKGYDVVTATINTGGFDEKTLTEIEKKAIELGSIKHYNIQAEEKIYEQIIQYLIKLNGLYEDDYPVMCADRYVIAQEILSIAEKENCNTVAHGSTAVGNDQVRFDSAFLTLKNDVKILSPIKELNITRDDEIEYLKERGFNIDVKSKKYSINHNIFGSTVSGSEIDINEEPDISAYNLTKVDKTLNSDSYEYITIDFAKGLPVALNSIKMGGLNILKQLNKIVGRYGYGSRIYVGDCIIGIKGRIMFEAPGLFVLLKAHRKLEQMTLTKEQYRFNNYASQSWSNLVYIGMYYEPLVRNLESYSDSVQEKVNGRVKVKVQLNKIEIVEINSPNSLIRDDIATYAQKSTWTAEEANGFIKFHSLPQVLSNLPRKNI
ncbi:MAG: argininosuccinate synthase [Ignavibacteriales bacterium]|nr:argininosuccinate synthase [Ignavibacteriales bacterium]